MITIGSKLHLLAQLIPLPTQNYPPIPPAVVCSNVRKEWSSMSPAEKSLYVEAVALNSRSGQGTTVLGVHGQTNVQSFAHR